MDKKQIIIISLFIISFLFILMFDVPFPFRYTYKGTSTSIIYKIDRFTGKVWYGTPSSGWKLIENKNTPTTGKWVPVN